VCLAAILRQAREASVGDGVRVRRPRRAEGAVLWVQQAGEPAERAEGGGGEVNWMQWCCVAYVALVVGAVVAFVVSVYLLLRRANAEMHAGMWGESWKDDAAL